MRSEEDIRDQIMRLGLCSERDESIRKAIVRILQWVAGDHDIPPGSDMDYFEYALDEIKDVALTRIENLKQSTEDISTSGEEAINQLKTFVEDVKALRAAL